jgi:DNA-binding GntR family transcriptional regulator
VLGKFAHLGSVAERQTTADAITDVLREAILSGNFEDGEELNQVELAEHFSVSRVPVREAIRRLQAEGLVSAEAHRLASVVGFTRERIAEIFDIRALLEVHALERAALNFDSDVPDRLERLCDEMDATGNRSRWLKLNHEFHRTLLAPSGATTAIALVDQLSARVERYVRRSGGTLRPEVAGTEHRRIAAALRDGEPARAEEALRDHILHTRDAVLQQLSIGVDAPDE